MFWRRPRYRCRYLPSSTALRTAPQFPYAISLFIFIFLFRMPRKASMLRFLQSRSTSDSEYIHRISKTIEFWDRWRKSILFVSLIALVGILGFLAWLANFLDGVPANNALAININKIHLGIAFGLGVTFGLHLHSVMGYIISSAVGGYRSERMLLKLYAE